MLILRVGIFTFTQYSRHSIYLLAEHCVSLSSKGAGHSYMTKVQFVLLTVVMYLHKQCF